MVTKLIFIRHGEAKGNTNRVFHGFYDSDLTKKGRMQINRAAERLKDEKIDFMYSSDLKRAFETAYKIASYHNLDVYTDERLREINGGEWENLPWDNLPKKHKESFYMWLNEPHNLKIPGGESMEQFALRLRTVIEEIIKKHEGKTICLATHGTAIRVLFCYFYNRPLSAMNSVMWCDNASMSVAEYENGIYRVTVDGDNSYLKDILPLQTRHGGKNRRNNVL